LLLRPSGDPGCATGQAASRERIAIDGKTVRVSKIASEGSGVLHLVSARAPGAGLILTERLVETESNESLAPRVFADPSLTAGLGVHPEAAIGGGCMEERTGLLLASADWLNKRAPAWNDFACIVAIRARRTHKKTGRTSGQISLDITLRAPAPALLPAAVRAHGSFDNNLHWILDITVNEDQCRTGRDWIRNDTSATGLALLGEEPPSTF
jgi:hypothetical protein